MFLAGLGEETVFRGFMFERLGKLWGSSILAKISIVMLTSLWFALGHYTNMGITGVEQALITGLVFGTIYASTRRLFMLMCMHTAYDLTALALIYWDLETQASHFIF